jgi:methylglutaconyl-CoA hydratase
MPYQYLMTRREGHVEYLTLNRPDVRNAFNDIVVGELMDWASRAHDAAGRGELRVAVVAGAGKTFSAGADIGWMAKTAAYSEEENLRDATTTSGMFAAIDQLPIPLIGRVHGAALGGGCGLAAVCDIVVADDRTVFGFTEVKLGIVPAVISPFVLAKIGRAAARELFLTGARFGAARAKEIGLVQVVVSAADLDATIGRYVGELLTGGAEAIAAAKALIAQVSSLPLADAMPLSARAIAARRVSAEGQEGLNAFVEKRKPRWVTDGT